VFHSLLFSNVYVRARSYLKDCVVLPDVEIGEDCRLNKVLLERGCRVPDGTVIGEDLKEDAKHYHVTPNGVVLVIPEMLGERRFRVR
jgi:glucose-1-phosphate adenylyltransferase